MHPHIPGILGFVTSMKAVSLFEIRSQIYETIAAINPLDPIEHSHIRFVLDWIESGDEIFRTENPATPKMHLVSYFAVVSMGRDQILLVDHKKAELWLPPGGHVEPGELPQDTVRREAKEELGMEAKFLIEQPIFLTVAKTSGNTVPHTDVSLWYLLQGDPARTLNFDAEEFHQIRWFGLEEVPFDRTDSHMKRFISKMR